MSSKRKQIRKNVVSRLHIIKDFKGRIVANRSDPNWQENLPALNIYMRGEAVTEHSQAPRRMKRLLEMDIEIIASGRDGEELSDKLDNLAESVERCLSVDDTLGGCADDILLQNVSDMEAESGGSATTGSLTLTFIVSYYEFAPRDRAGQGNFEDFDTLQAEWDLQPGQDEADRAKDKITITP